MLTKVQKDRVLQLFMLGASNRYEGFADKVQADLFWTNPDVREELTRIMLEYDNSDAGLSRVRYGAQRALIRMVPKSLDLMAAGLAGPIYERDTDGHIMYDTNFQPKLLEAAPTNAQLGIAEDVLDRLGVKEDTDLGARDISVKLLMGLEAKAVDKLTYNIKDASPEQRALSRERVRNAINFLIPKVAKAR